MHSTALNHVYRLVWSEFANAWVAVAEHTSGRGKRSRSARALIVLSLLGAASSASAQVNVLPTAGHVVAGSGTIGQSGSTMTVTQASDRLVVDWNSFDIGARSGVRFAQPGSGSIALNRVTGGSASSILGSLTANGQVWLINPSGVVFGSSARVDVGGLVASSLALSNSDFLAGRNRFTGGTGAGAVVNRGSISATGGVVALLAPQVRNEGTITTTGGSTVLAAGDRVSLDFGSDGLVSVAIDASVVDAAVRNSGTISAAGGMVVLSARSANKALDSVVNNTGVIEAQGLVARDGRILLDGDADQGGTHVAGTLDVSSASGRGGSITVTGHDITLDHGATLDASGATGGGSIRVGGGFQGNDPTVANATTVGADASVTARADATGNGDGGKVVFWSDDATRFAGDLSVRGGARGGDGGRIEVSGKQDLSYSGHADARAPLGRTGDLLLDPATVTVSGGGSGSGGVTGTTVYEKDLEAQNANVLLQATGNVTFNDLNLNGGDGRISMANNVSLRVESDTGATSNTQIGDITFANAANTIEVFGTGSLVFIAGAMGMGNVVNAPNLVAHGAGTNPVTLPVHNVSVVGSGTPGDGSITLFGADGVTVGGALTTNGGYVRVWADSDDASGGGYTLSAPLVTNGGNFYVSAGSGVVLLNADMTLGAGRILFKADGSYTDGPRTLGGLLSASGAVNVSTPFTMNAGAGILTDGPITFSNTVNLNTGAGALRLRASAIDFTAATLSNLSTASLILEPANPATSMVLGDANGFASATTLAKLPGVKNLTIGRTDGTGTTSVASNFSFAATSMLEVVNRTIDITGGTLTNTAGNVTLTGDNVNISKQITAKAGTGAVTLRQLTAANSINLGSGLPNSVIGEVNAATLVIGRSDGGNVTFDSNIATTASTVHLLSGGRVIGTAGGVSAANLAIDAGGGATLSAPAFNFTKLGLAVGGSTTITQTNSGFDIGAVDGVAGLAISTGSNANVTLQGQGAITASGPMALNGNTSTVSLNAASVNLASSTVSGATNTSFALRPLNAADNLAIGGTSGFATTTTLGKLTNSKNVTVGRSDGSGLSTVQAFFELTASGTLEVVNGRVALGGSVRNNGGGLKLTALTGNLALGAYNATATNGQLTLSATGASVGGTGSVIAPSLLINAPLVAVTLTGAGNNVGTIAGNAGSLSFVDTASLVVGTVGGVNGVNTAGNLTLRTTGAAADLTLNQAVSSAGAGNAVVLSAGRNFINNSGASAISATGGGRWLVYSGSPLNDTRGGLAYAFKQYNTANLATALGSGNGFVYRVAPTVTIGLAGATSKVYDGNATATLAPGNYTNTGTIDGDTVAFASTGATYATKGVATGKGVSANGLSLTGASNGAATVYGYQLAGTTATGNIGQITPATLTVGAASVANKVYDATAVASVNSVALTGVIGSDAIGTTATGAFADKNVANGKAVAVNVALTGADAGNYVLSSTTSNGIANITPATLMVASSNIADKVYDATTNASVNGVVLSGVFENDVIGATATGAFADKNVGNGKVVALNTSLTGADAGNYVVSPSGANGLASITPALLTVGVAAVADKVYDATTAASVGAVALTGVIGDDVIGTSATGAFVNKKVGTNKAVAVDVALTGADAGNYVLSSPNASGAASITRATLTVASSTIADKVYDATTNASVGHVVLSGVFENDAIGATATGTFADKNVGNRKIVALDTALTGADAGNYVVSPIGASGSASITPATLTVGSATVADKVYDATTVASVGAIALTGVIGDDVIATTANGTFANKNVGTGKAVTVDGVALTGTDAGNYVLDTTASAGAASITPAVLTVGGATVADKVYDANTVASVSAVALTGVIGEDVIGTIATGNFANKNVGSGKTVTVGGVTLTGTDAANYVLESTTSTGTASITPAMLTAGGATVADKVYDATTVASVGAVALTGVIGDDVIGTTGTGSFANKNVGTGKTVTVGGVTLTGADAGNYALETTNSIGTASITPAVLTVGGATVADKVYDATTIASVSAVALTGVIGDDVIGTSATGSFANKNVGSGKTVTVGGVTLTGADAGNYALETTSSIGIASITPAMLTVGSATVADKVYDATTLASVGAVALTGVIGDDVIGTTATGSFANKNVGSAKAVTVGGVTLTGTDAGNYVLDTTSSIGIASITPAMLTVGRATVADKVYDATTVASVGAVALAGVIGDDVIGTTANGTFASKNVGTGKAVTVDGVTLTGADAGNYVLETTGSIGTASITPAVLTVGSAIVADKVYDATALASVSAVALAGVIGDDVIGTTASGSFANKNVGNGKTVNVGGVTLTGADAGNYVLETTNSIGTASITPAMLTIGRATVADKVYDATTGASVSAIALTGVIGDDVIGTTGTGSFANKNVGSGKAVTVGGVTLTGADAGNYALETTSSIGIASITPALLAIGNATVADKVYDATTIASVSAVALTGVIGGDVIGTTANGTFANKNVGNGKTVTVGDVTLTGADAGNYVLETTGSIGTASITPAMLAVGGATVVDKVYDANTVASVSGVALTGVIGDDVIGTTATGTFANKNVGIGKTVTVDGIVLTGSDAGNYRLETTGASGRATITPATLGVGAATVADKTFDGNTSATVGAVDLFGVIAGDRVAADASGRFVDAEVGAAKPVLVSGIALGGADAGNYALARTDTSGRASIEPVAGPAPVAGPPPVAGPVPVVGPVPVIVPVPVTGPAPIAVQTPVAGPPPVASPAPVAAPSPVAGPTPVAGPVPVTDPAPVAALEPSSISTGTLAALTSPQIRSNGTAGGPDAMARTGDALTTGTAPDASDMAVTRGLSTLQMGSGGDSAAARSDRAGRPSASDSGGILTGPMINVPDTLLTAGGQFSIALGGQDLVEAVAASLPVYSVAPGVPLQSEGQFLVTDNGSSLSLTATGDERVSAPSLTQQVSGSTRAMVPLSSTESVEMRVDFLADHTLVATLPDLTASQATETLAAFGLVVAKSGLAIGVDDVRAIVLRFGSETRQLDGDGPNGERTTKRPA